MPLHPRARVRPENRFARGPPDERTVLPRGEDHPDAAVQLGLHPEDATRDQAVATPRLPFVFPHVALMPDAHLGKGATVGSVIPTLGAVIPAAVGVDIGCGMIAVRTPLGRRRPADGPARCAARGDRGRRTAVGRGLQRRRSRGSTPRTGSRTWRHDADAAGFDPATYAAGWRLQLGTLGSGNHFIEVSLDEEDRVWLFLHSGSRGVGNKIAAAPHHGRAAAVPAVVDRRCPTVTSPTWSRARTSSGPTSASCGGRRSSRCRTVPR